MAHLALSNALIPGPWAGDRSDFASIRELGSNGDSSWQDVQADRTFRLVVKLLVGQSCIHVLP
jgi:hypothetical protein